MLRVINNVSTTYFKSQNHIVSPAHADKAHRLRPLSLSLLLCARARAPGPPAYFVFSRACGVWSV